MNKNLTPLKQQQNVFRETNKKTAAGTMHDRIGQKEQRHKHQLNADADRRNRTLRRIKK